MHFLRKALGLTLEQWGKKFGLSGAGVLKWEKLPKKRLPRVNEAAVRSLCAELLDLEIDGRWSQLISSDKKPTKLSLQIKKAA